MKTIVDFWRWYDKLNGWDRFETFIVFSVPFIITAGTQYFVPIGMTWAAMLIATREYTILKDERTRNAKL